MTNWVLEFSEYESGGSSWDYDWLFTLPEVSEDSKIGDNGAVNHQRVSD